MAVLCIIRLCLLLLVISRAHTVSGISEELPDRAESAGARDRHACADNGGRPLFPDSRKRTKFTDAAEEEHEAELLFASYLESV